MTRKLLKAAALAAGALAVAPAAHADLVTIGVTEDSATPPAAATPALATNPGNGSADVPTGTTFGDYTFSASGQGTPPLSQPEFLTSSIAIQSTGSGTHVFRIWFTEQGLTTPTGINPFISSFTSNTQSATAVLEQTLISTTNALFTGTQLASVTFPANPTVNQINTQTTNSPSFAAPYSETAVYTITTTAADQNANLTIDMNSVAAPEPASLTLLGSALVGLGWLARRRKTV